MKHLKFIILLFLVLIFCMIFAPAVSAHRVHVREQVSEIQIKAWFGGGDPMAFADVEVHYNRSGEQMVLTGKTDEEGIYYFTPELGVSNYKVNVSASGHKGEHEFNLSQGAQQEAELPLYMKILTGFGLLAGLAGIAMYISAKKIQKECENK